MEGLHRLLRDNLISAAMEQPYPVVPHVLPIVDEALGSRPLEGCERPFNGWRERWACAQVVSTHVKGGGSSRREGRKEQKGKLLDAPEWSTSDDPGTLYKAGVGQVKLVGKEPAGRQP
jgi:hypothetical protein